MFFRKKMVLTALLAMALGVTSLASAAADWCTGEPLRKMKRVR